MPLFSSCVVVDVVVETESISGAAIVVQHAMVSVGKASRILSLPFSHRDCEFRGPIQLLKDSLHCRSPTQVKRERRP